MAASSSSGAGAGGYAPYHRRTLSNTTLSQMGTYRSSPLAQQSASASASGAGANGLPASSSLTSLFLPQNDYHTPSAASSSPSSRAMSPLPPVPSDRASTPLAFVANNSRSRPYSPSVDTIDTPPPPHSSNNRLPTFQPKGLAVNRTADFIAHRKRKQDNGRLEDGRLARRLEKVLAIHHNPVPLPGPSSSSKFLDSSSSSAAVGEGYDSAEEPLLAFASNTASTLRKASSNLWATLRAASAVHNSSSDNPSSSSGFLSTLEAARNKAAQDAARRTAEQSIVKWQADADARACPICSSPFSLAVRKHHCRLCGRVVCASPQLTAPIFPTTATATGGTNAAGGPTTSSTALVDPVKAASLLAEQKCSGLIVLTDARTGKVDDARKVAAEAAVGAASVAEMSTGAGGGGGRGVGEVALRNLESHVEERAIRVCKDCRKVIFRQQYMLESGPTPTWLKLYEALIRLQREIEESLPEFHEMVLGL
ncbi:hypothetical protein CF328_g6754, partial [Tilletia controversa]